MTVVCLCCACIFLITWHAVCACYALKIERKKEKKTTPFSFACSEECGVLTQVALHAAAGIYDGKIATADVKSDAALIDKVYRMQAVLDFLAEILQQEHTSLGTYSSTSTRPLIGCLVSSLPANTVVPWPTLSLTAWTHRQMVAKRLLVSLDWLTDEQAQKDEEAACEVQSDVEQVSALRWTILDVLHNLLAGTLLDLHPPLAHDSNSDNNK